jgi:hypothetical protein
LFRGVNLRKLPPRIPPGQRAAVPMIQLEIGDPEAMRSIARVTMQSTR